MPRPRVDPESPVQRRLATYIPVTRALDPLTVAAKARVLVWVKGLVDDGDTAAAELAAMKSIAYRLGQVDDADRAHIVRRLHEDYAAPDGATPAATATTATPTDRTDRAVTRTS